MSSYEYFDRVLFPTGIQWPEIASVSETELLVAGYSCSTCFHVDLPAGAVVAGPIVSDVQFRVGDCLRTPSGSEARAIYAVATQAGWGAIWKRGARECTRIHPTIYGRVNTVSVSPEREGIAIGTGYYVLGGDEPIAAVELWSDDGSKCRASRRMPGVVVDQIAWTGNRGRIIAAVGARSQDRGFLVVLEPSLAIVDIVETGSCRVSCLADLPDEGLLCVVYQSGLEVRDTDDPRGLRWWWQSEQKIAGAAVDRANGRVLLGTGHCIDIFERTVEGLDPLPGCNGLAERPGGGFFGLSESGVLRTWVPKS